MPQADRAADFRARIRRGERRAIARAITLVESARADRQALGREILDGLLEETGGALRVGLSGPPGVGKSSFIEALGLRLIEAGLQVAVLAVDPSSPVSGGSILGDKTRMERLARSERAFIRPSPSGGVLGGVAHRTREALLLCEAAGFQVVIVETVGIGQSESAVRSMVDFFAVLLQPGAGDELQGLKKGALELADALVVNKADGEQQALAQRARAEFERALALLPGRDADGRPRVLAASAHTGEGVAEFWQCVQEHHAAAQHSGAFAEQRRRQDREWLWTLLREGLERAFLEAEGVAEQLARLEAAVAARQITPAAAAAELLARIDGPPARR